MTTLKPCPFCGGPAKLRGPCISNEPHATLFCSNPECLVAPYVVIDDAGGEINHETQLDKAAKLAAERWNKREGRLEVLEEAVRRLRTCSVCGDPVDADDAWCGCGPERATLQNMRDENERLRDLVGHCWIHSGYRDCGYVQMTTEQKALYDAVKRCD